GSTFPNDCDLGCRKNWPFDLEYLVAQFPCGNIRPFKAGPKVQQSPSVSFAPSGAAVVAFELEPCRLISVMAAELRKSGTILTRSRYLRTTGDFP
ncbi:MAG: hypothetical protein ACRED2_09970, partial [Methylocella sp.]